MCFFIVPVLSGLLLTYFYTPDVIDAYNDVEYLQNEVSFGFVQRPGNAEMLVPFFLGLVAYFILLFVVQKIKR
ncbi:hypothetical protein [Brevibacillus panacihumi]|uniref:hypothetical protein n=1 Tax=Brevibacillus panacihumi TaxID=497735 RepID=UPI0033B6E18F